METLRDTRRLKAPRVLSSKWMTRYLCEQSREVALRWVLVSSSNSRLSVARVWISLFSRATKPSPASLMAIAWMKLSMFL